MREVHKIFLAGMFVLLFLGAAHARLNTSGAQPGDQVCFGGGGARAAGLEVCLESDGDWVPTISSANTPSQSLGTRSNPWRGLSVSTIQATGLVTTSSITTQGIVTLGQQLLLFSATSTVVAATVPLSTGAVLFNSTINSLCLSTGIAAGAWVLPRSTSTSSTLIPCY